MTALLQPADYYDADLGGWWRLSRGTRRFFPDAPTPRVAPAKPATIPPPEPHLCDGGCGRTIDPRSTYCADCWRDVWSERTPIDHLMATLERRLAEIPERYEVETCDCGCSLVPGELCPACVRPWMYAVERAGNLATFQHRGAA